MHETVQTVEFRPIYREEFQTALNLAWRTFLQFEAADYEEEGMRSFYQFINDPVLPRAFALGEYRVWGAFISRQMVGMISTRSKNYISLLFVDREYHHRGIGRGLVRQVFRYCHSEWGVTEVSVHASPYAVGFYHKIGFMDTDVELKQDGIRYTPMLCHIPA